MGHITAPCKLIVCLTDTNVLCVACVWLPVVSARIAVHGDIASVLLYVYMRGKKEEGLHMHMMLNIEQKYIVNEMPWMISVLQLG